MDIKLNIEEAGILKEALTKANYRLDFSYPSEKEKIVLSIGGDQADDIRDICADYLQEIGFDESYVPTEKGRLLETLIDKFFTG